MAAAAGPSAAPAQLRAVVKAVLSPDTVVLRGRATATGPAPERQLSFAYITAPRLGRKDEKDEPFAWEAREFLRKKLVGKEVMFQVEYTIPNTGREFGTVFVGGESVTLALLRAGLVRVRESRGKDDLSELQAAEAEANEAGRGLHGDTSTAVVREVKHLEDDARAFVEKYKGKQLDAIVERVNDGSTLQVLLLPSFHFVTVILSGVKAPAYRKDVPDRPDLIEPYGAEAKYFTETRLLQQDVKVILEGQNNKTLVGTVLHPNGNIAEALVRDGLAKVVDWSITLVTGGPARLRDLEKAAKQQKVRIWRDYQPKAEAANKDIVGTVTRIWNGESLTITTATGEEHKVFLSSIRQPRAKEPSEAPYQSEAKEFLRSRLIGKKVTAKVDYVKPVEDGYEQRVCVTLISDGV